MHISLRDARPDELTEAGALTAAVYRAEDLAEGDYLDRLADAAARHAADGASQIVALDTAGRILGTGVYVQGGSEYADLAEPEEAEIRMLATAADARGRGVGEALVRECVARARAEGRPRLVLSSKPVMAAAHRLYERVGFVRAPERDWEYAPGKGLMTFVMVLEADTDGVDAPTDGAGIEGAEGVRPGTCPGAGADPGVDAVALVS